nr:peptidoglycan DD-metalloendopeptidase family protein [Eubacterium maltosivorans]
MQSSFSSGKLDVGTVVDKLDDNIPALVAKLGVDPKEAASLIYPLLGTAGTLTSVFGGRDAPTAGASTNHGGIDLAAPTGTQIAAVLGGLVTIAGEYGGYGNAVKIDHGNGVESLYGHMSAVGVAPGQQVTAGQVIGNVGSTGISTGPHLHLSMYKDGEAIDPLPYVQGAPIMAGNTLAGALMAEYNRRKFGIGAAGALGGGGDVASWIMQALAITGQSMDYLDELLYIAQMESGGDPNAINLWDSNAAAGHPSKGLMQTIDSTFAAYALPGYDDIWNPVHNAIAAIRYMNERYGGIQNHPGLGGRGYVGYAVGTREVPQDMLAVIHKDEAIFPAAQNPFSKSGGDMIADMVSNVLPFPEMESNSIRNEKGDFAERNNMIEFPERKSDTGQSTVGEAVPVVVPQSTAAGGVSVSINLGGISVSIEGSNAGTPQDIEALLRAQIPGIANDLCAQIAQKLTEILAGMPTRSEAV